MRYIFSILICGTLHGQVIFPSVYTPPVASGNITLDDTTHQQVGNDSVFTAVHVVGSGSNIVMLVFAAVDEAGGEITTVKNNTTNTLLTKFGPNVVLNNITMGCWYYLSPPAGPNTLVFRADGSVRSVLGGDIITFSNCKQQAPEAWDTTWATGTSLPLSVPTVTNNAMLINAAMSTESAGAFTATSGQTVAIETANGEGNEMRETVAYRLITTAALSAANETNATSGDLVGFAVSLEKQ